MFHECEFPELMCESHKHDSNITIMGYRSYVKYTKKGAAGDAARQFKEWVRLLKEGNAAAIQLFSTLLCGLWKWPLRWPQLIVPIPSSQIRKANTRTHLDSVAQEVARAGYAVYRASVLARSTAIPPCRSNYASRNPRMQYNSMQLNPLDAKLPLVTRILVFDDVLTTGSTMSAAIRHLREEFPAVKIIGFAFGVSNDVQPDNWIDLPKWPMHNCSRAEITGLLEQDWNARAYMRATWPCRLVMNGYNRIVHDVRCVHAREMTTAVNIKSFVDAISRGNRFCSNCMPGRLPSVYFARRGIMHALGCPSFRNDEDATYIDSPDELTIRRCKICCRTER